MQKIKILVLMLVSLLFVQCKEAPKNIQTTKLKSELTQTTNANTSGLSLTADINGKAFKALNGSIQVAKKNASLHITGAAATGEGIYIQITNYKGIGTYKLGLKNIDASNPSPNMITYGLNSDYEDVEEAAYMSESGIVQITAVSGNTISGIFKASVKNVENSSKTLEITNGKFQVNNRQ